MYLTLYQIFKITKCNRSSLKSIIKFLNIQYIEIIDEHNILRKIYSESDLEKIKLFLKEHPYPKTYFSELTNIKKYGVKNQFQRKEVHDLGIVAANTEESKTARKQTNNKKYNGDCPTADPIIMEKARTTRIKNNGKYWSDAMIEKIKNTKFERHGDQNYNNRDLAKLTCLEKYNVPHPMQNKEVSSKLCGKLSEEKRIKKYNATVETSLKKYHVRSPNQYHSIICKQRKKYKYNNINFDSSWELAYYIWLNDNNIVFEYHPNISFTYFYNGKQHEYFPDFKIGNSIYEIKGEHLLKKMLIENTLENAKYNCMIQNNVNIIINCKSYLNYIKEKYGKSYLKQFKNK